MNSSTPFDLLTMPTELWIRILAHCSQRDMAQMCRVHSQLLEVSMDSLYFKLLIWNEDYLISLLSALRNSAIARRIRHVVVDPGRRFSRTSLLETLLGILSTCSLIRLDIDTLDTTGVHFSKSDWENGLLLRFAQLPQLQRLKLSISFFKNVEFGTILRTTSLSDLDVSDERLFSQLRPATARPTVLPILDTLRLRYFSPKWRYLLGYLDLSSMKRLGIWDNEEQVTDLAYEWGGLVTASAITLESLSLWLTSNILELDIPAYLHSIPDFPSLHTLSLFLTVGYFERVPTFGWMNTLLPILVAFHSCSPSLRHIRCYVHAWWEIYTYQTLLDDQKFEDFARVVSGLRNLETIKFTFGHSQSPSFAASDMERRRLASLFHPVRPSVKYEAIWSLLWPFFTDDYSDAEWTRMTENVSKPIC
ncbi:hypothetical protein DL96DRAFT_1688425 [Flagelloscypha sp. PMI_526]|nr:hypothetical protein DL96DRAFT_1688425 [Flagelloscypha sp. PMI_526]